MSLNDDLVFKNNSELSKGFFKNARPLQPILQILTAVIVESDIISVRIFLSDGEEVCDRFGFSKSIDEKIIGDGLDNSTNMSVIKLLDYHFHFSTDNFGVTTKIIVITDYNLVSNPGKNLSTEIIHQVEDPVPFFTMLDNEMFENP